MNKALELTILDKFAEKRSFASFSSWVNVVSFLSERPELLNQPLVNSKISVNDLLKESNTVLDQFVKQIRKSTNVQLNGSSTHQYNLANCGNSDVVSHCQNAFSLFLRVNVVRTLFMGNQWKDIKNEFMWNNDVQRESLEKLGKIVASEFGRTHLTLASL